jgi:hypothetical protein
MRVTYYSAQGAVRMVYLNVTNSRTVRENIVELQGTTRWQDTENGKAILAAGTVASYRCYDQYYTIALIHLAPGEYLEWSKDAERS